MKMNLNFVYIIEYHEVRQWEEEKKKKSLNHMIHE